MVGEIKMEVNQDTMVAALQMYFNVVFSASFVPKIISIDGGCESFKIVATSESRSA
jgi:hypothetical protein